MAIRFIVKSVRKREAVKPVAPINDKKEKKEEVMTAKEINNVEQLLKGDSKVKVVKKERGLIERKESEKVVLTEDNRQVLND